MTLTPSRCHWHPLYLFLLFVGAEPVAAQTTRDIALQVFHRIGFGPTPALLAAHQTPTALATYVTNQLNPTNPQTDNAAVQSMLPHVGLPAAQNSSASLNTLHLNRHMRALLCDWQLNERMTGFWNTHFNRSHDRLKFFDQFITGGTTGADNAAWFLLQDDAYYRGHALGSFRDLLGYTAGSVSMLIYLDNYLSTATNLNQNWGRELLELFSMGRVNASTGGNNYTQDDVIKAARCFTGWTITGSNGSHAPLIPTSADASHDSAQKSMFRSTVVIPAGGTAWQDGNLLLDYVAGAEGTKDFMVRKLMRFFLGEDAPAAYPTILTSAKAAWGTQGDIKAVLTAILLPPTPQASPLLTGYGRWSKIKDPEHFAVSMARAAGAVPQDIINPTTNQLDHLQWQVGYVELMGQPLYHYPTPDGYPEENEAQVSSSGVLDRMDLASATIPVPLDTLKLDLRFEDLVIAGLPQNPGLPIYPPPANNPNKVADFLLQHFFGDKVLHAGDKPLVVAQLGDLVALPQGSPDYALRIRLACTTILRMTHASLH